MGLGLTLVFYIYKRSAQISYRLARNRGKTTEAPVLYKAIPVYPGDKDDVFMEEEISTESAELDETNAHPHRCKTARVNLNKPGQPFLY